MKTLVREILLANGLTVRFYDATRRYFGDYHQVRVTISCEVPLAEELFEDTAAFQSALKLLGDRVQYLKEVEHQGVAGEATGDAVERVIRQFEEHSLSYFQNEAFPRKLVQSELNRLRQGRGALRANG